MALKAHLEHDIQKDGREDARRDERRSLFLETSGSLPGGLEANVLIHNISASGLLIETDMALAVDEKLILDLPEAEAVRATVVWQSGFLYGCAFEEALEPNAMAAVQLRADPVAAPSGPALESPPEPLGVKLNRLRRERGLTLAQVASVLGVSKPTVWAWEKGKARPLPDRIEAIAQVLGVEAQELEERLGDAQHSALVQECRVRIATAYGTHPSKVRIMIEV
ncbi:MAG: helix-turn-helix domain-containing protein [Erythrobacter sp.]|uniref:helix-turn-helix domain-containing protein n=1 Tax=Erythrobacter sp. TaxID=1042 RepID=UPI0026206140|nr:helix-turn-helix domain-containing protein [Erythrobacter sp.]MDJ0979395.1 helix-turn-helix domain-containing protein [Erythrobacter sp.]